MPIAGSSYTYAYATLGELVAWIIGWDLILEYALGATAVAIGWSGYVVSFFKDFGIVLLPPIQDRRSVKTPRRTRGAASGWDVAQCFRLDRPNVLVLYTLGKQ